MATHPTLKIYREITLGLNIKHPSTDILNPTDKPTSTTPKCAQLFLQCIQNLKQYFVQAELGYIHFFI